MSKEGLVVITGATSGIGKASAFAFSNAGYPLLLLGRRLYLLEEMDLPNTIAQELDVTNLVAFQKAVQEAENKYGPVQCLVNNAGVLFLGSLDNQSPDEWKQMIDTNVLGVLNGIKVVLSSMKERRSGTIINISSVAGIKNYPHHDVYCGTKFGVSSITEGLREEVAPHGVRCISICPGVVETEILTYQSSEELKRKYEDNKKTMGKLITSEEIAQIILFVYQQPAHICIREIVVCPTGQVR